MLLRASTAHVAELVIFPRCVWWLLLMEKKKKKLYETGSHLRHCSLIFISEGTTPTPSLHRFVGFFILFFFFPFPCLTTSDSRQGESVPP